MWVLLKQQARIAIGKVCLFQSPHSECQAPVYLFLPLRCLYTVQRDNNLLWALTTIYGLMVPLYQGRKAKVEEGRRRWIGRHKLDERLYEICQWNNYQERMDENTSLYPSPSIIPRNMDHGDMLILSQVLMKNTHPDKAPSHTTLLMLVWGEFWRGEISTLKKTLDTLKANRNILSW